MASETRGRVYSPSRPAHAVPAWDDRPMSEQHADHGRQDTDVEEPIEKAHHEAAQEGEERLHRSWPVLLATGFLGGVEITIGLLRDGGFDDATAAIWFRSLSDFLLGQAMLDGSFTGLPPEVRAADHAAWQDLPDRVTQASGSHAEAAAPHLRRLMLESSFEHTMALMLAGLATMPRSADGAADAAADPGDTAN